MALFRQSHTLTHHVAVADRTIETVSRIINRVHPTTAADSGQPPAHAAARPTAIRDQTVTGSPPPSSTGRVATVDQEDIGVLDPGNPSLGADG